MLLFSTIVPVFLFLFQKTEDGMFSPQTAVPPKHSSSGHRNATASSQLASSVHEQRSQMHVNTMTERARPAPRSCARLLLVWNAVFENLRIQSTSPRPSLCTIHMDTRVRVPPLHPWARQIALSSRSPTPLSPQVLSILDFAFPTLTHSSQALLHHPQPPGYRYVPSVFIFRTQSDRASECTIPFTIPLFVRDSLLRGTAATFTHIR